MSVKESLQQELQEVEKRRHGLMPEHQKVQKKSKRYTASMTKEGTCRKKMQQHKKRCGRSERKTVAMRSVFGSCRTKSIRTKWRMQKMAAELRTPTGRRREERQQCLANR